MVAELGNELAEELLPHGVTVGVCLQLTHVMLGETGLHLSLRKVVQEPCLSVIRTLDMTST